jgi:hypothetical protein
MNETPANPFIPGARVAITDGWDNWREGFVEKQYKNGRFVLKGSDQQWRPSEPSQWRPYWTASKTGDQGWHRRDSLRIWNDAADIEIKECFAAQARKRRWAAVRERIGRVQPDAITDQMLDQIEAALPPLKTAMGPT